jgi:predicted alpha/beta hydrolase family esterase
MKKVYIVHGWGGSPDEPMHKWLRESLEARDVEVHALVMPHPDTPTIEDWVNHLKENCSVDVDTYLICHSVGCQAILRYLETLSDDARLKKIILIAPWVLLTVENLDETEEEEIARPWMETPIDYEKIKTHVSDITAIFSDNDPFVPLEWNKKLLEEKLNAKTIVLHNKGHFTESDNVISLPEVLEEIK